MSQARTPTLLILAGLLLYGVIITPFTSYMVNKPIEEKLGYMPSMKVLELMSADQKELVGAAMIMKVVMYFGGIMGQAQEGKVISQPPDLRGMSRILHGAVQLDPYNMDAYYFAQGFLTWDAKQYQLANELLEYGMKYRTWDWYLPFFIGFNKAYFLKDFAAAAKFYQRAGELSGNDLFKNLAGRYMQESGQTDLAIAYLSAMEKGETNQSMKKNYQIRLEAFKEVKRIEVARDLFVNQYGKLPDSVEQLAKLKLLNPAAADPYGGRFYLGPEGKVASSSNFSFGGKKKGE